MLSKKMVSFKKLARKVKMMSTVSDVSFQRDLLLTKCEQKEAEDVPFMTPKGSFAVYVGEERRRFAVPMGYLSNPLFQMLLDEARDEFGFEQREGLVVPCSVNAFREVISAIESCNRRFHFGQLVNQFF